ncbi:MAG: HD domain-containing protein [Planctomycetota bacterium]|jgi:hypothetical protein|nr:HD domain-containing protein [Planctomycetota bacterium]
MGTDDSEGVPPIDRILDLAVAYNGRDVKRVNHLLKVHSFARLLGIGEKCGPGMLTVVEAAALLHDIGIHEAERKHGSSAGKWQELEGPPVARELLEGLDLDPAARERILFLVGHHHSYGSVDGLDFQILVEADFLVNIHEEGMDVRSIESLGEGMFKTASGRELLERLYLR